MFQLPPIRMNPVFANFKNDELNLYHPWHLSRMIELTDILRQKDDSPFDELLNRFRTATHSEEDIKCIQAGARHPLDDNYPSEALRIWAENQSVDQHKLKLS